ncbi:MAG: hypothetical protein ACK5PS_06120 [Desulfopila sp.]
MTNNPMSTGQCPVCEQMASLAPCQGVALCRECAELAATIATRKRRVHRLYAILADTGNEPVLELPEVLDAKRYRTRDRENNSWYVSISEMEGEPVEIFASTAFDRDQHLQSRISDLTTITRLISLILRHISLGEQLTLAKTLNQLQRSSRQRYDLPDMLARVLGNYTKKPHLDQPDDANDG